MRSINSQLTVSDRQKHRDHEDRLLAQLAAEYAEQGIDDYSDYGVGAIVVVDFYDSEVDGDVDERNFQHIYAGFNINLSGFQHKVHAEQLALFQAILDIETSGLKSNASLNKVIVATTDNDLALHCGHCLQVISAACREYGWNKRHVGYIGAAYTGEEKEVQNYHTSGWELDIHTVAELFGDSYIQTRE